MVRWSEYVPRWLEYVGEVVLIGSERIRIGSERILIGSEVVVIRSGRGLGYLGTWLRYVPNLLARPSLPPSFSPELGILIAVQPRYFCGSSIKKTDPYESR